MTFHSDNHVIKLETMVDTLDVKWGTVTVKPEAGVTVIVNKKVLLLTEGITESPFFFFINYMDAHDPYRPPRSHSAFVFPVLSIIKSKVLNFFKITDTDFWPSFVKKQYATRNPKTTVVETYKPAARKESSPGDGIHSKK